MRSNQGELLHQVLAIVIKELRILLRDRQALALLFAMPAFFILVMSFALEGVFESGSRDRPIEIMVVNRDRGEVSRGVISDLKRMEGVVLIEFADGAPLSLKTAEEAVGKGRVGLALVIQEGFSDKILLPPKDTWPKATITFIHDPATNIRLLSGVKGTIQGIIHRRALTAAIPHRLKRALRTEGTPSSYPTGSWSQILDENIDGLLAQAGKEDVGQPLVEFLSLPPQHAAVGRFPTATEQNIPGYTIFGVFFIVLTLASSFIQEKKDGAFQRIMAAPLNKAAFMVGKLLPYYLVNLVQIALMFAVGVIFFHIQLGNLLALGVVSLALALAATGLGLLVAALGKTEAQVGGWSVLLAIILAALGGMMVPSYIMPETMKTLSLFTPHAWALAGYHDVMVRGLGMREVIPETGVLLGFGGVFFILAIWRFRFH
jgi:ABC-2 type transport system permease protein